MFLMTGTTIACRLWNKNALEGSEKTIMDIEPSFQWVLIQQWLSRVNPAIGITQEEHDKTHRDKRTRQAACVDMHSRYISVCAGRAKWPKQFSPASKYPIFLMRQSHFFFWEKQKSCLLKNNQYCTKLQKKKFLDIKRCHQLTNDRVRLHFMWRKINQSIDHWA